MAEATTLEKSCTSCVEDLHVYQRAFEVSIEVHKASLSFPDIERYVLADQMRRASKSICANIAEGYAKQSFSTAEFKRFLGMAIASASEMRVWVQYAYRLGYVDTSCADRWRQEYIIVEKMAGKLRASVGKDG